MSKLFLCIRRALCARIDVRSETHESRFREIVAELWQSAKVEQPDLPDLEPDEILAQIQCRVNLKLGGVKS